MEHAAAQRRTHGMTKGRASQGKVEQEDKHSSLACGGAFLHACLLHLLDFALPARWKIARWNCGMRKIDKYDIAGSIPTVWMNIGMKLID